jgi:hypothetical protein
MASVDINKFELDIHVYLDTNFILTERISR